MAAWDEDLDDTAAPESAGPAWAADLDEAQSEEQTSAVRINAMRSAATAPDIAASALRSSRTAGLPLEVVQRNAPEVSRRLLAERIDADTTAAPVLRERFADPAFAAVAHDDSTALAHLERTAGSYTVGQALRKGVAGLKLTLDFAADQLAGLVGADRTETRRILQETAGYYRAQGSDPGLAQAGERAKEAGGGTWYGTLLHLPGEVAAEEDPIGIVGRFMTEQLPGGLVGFGAGAAATAPVRAAIVSRISSGLVASGVNTAMAGAAGNSTAVVLQSLGVNYQEGIDQGLEPDAAASRAWTKTTAEVPANALAGAAMALRLGPNQLTNILGQSAVQGAGGGTGAAMAAHAVGEEADPVEIALEILGEGISAGPELAGLTYSRITGSRAAGRADAAEAARAEAANLSRVVEAANASALRQRDPQSFAEYVEGLQPDAAVYIAPEALDGVDLSAVPEVAAEVAEARAAGGDVQIRMADLLAYLPAEQLLPHLRATPEAMTADEASHFDGATELEAELRGPAPRDATRLQGPEAGAMSAEDWADYMAQADASAASADAQADRNASPLSDLQWLAQSSSPTASALQAEVAAARPALEAEIRSQVEAAPVYAAQRALAANPDLHPDVIAEAYGYSSGDALQQAISQAEPEASVVQRRVEQRMRDDFPDLTDTIASERAAQAAASDDARVRFATAEAHAMAEAIGTRPLAVGQARRYAEESISRRQIRDVRPERFQAAADRAARSAAAAMAAGDTVRAAERKRAQALQQALVSQSRAAEREIAQALQAFRRMWKPDDGARDGNLAAAARAILAQYGLGASEKTAADHLAQVERYDPDLHADLLVLLEGLPAPTPHYALLSVADFRAVRDRVQAIWKLARSTRQIEIDGQQVEIGAAASQLAEQLAIEPAAQRDQVVGRNERLDLRMRLAGMRAALRRVEHWADARDRGDAAGPFRRFIWQPVSEAVTRYRAHRDQHVGRFLELLRSIEPTLKPGKIAAPELGNGVVFADRSALLHALLHTGNGSNLRKLLVGYGWGSLREDGSLDTTRWDRFVSRMHSEKRITATDWTFVQSTWNLLEEMKPAAQRAHEAMFGFFFAEITAEPVRTPFGILPGGYVPSVVDSLLVPESRSHAAMSDMLSGQNSPMFPAVQRGFTKGRIEDYAKPLALDLRTLPAHIDKVSRFSMLGPTLRDTARLVMRNKSFRAAMDAVDSTAVEGLLVPWLKRVAAQTLTKPPETLADRSVARIANRLRNRTGLLLMAGNVVNTIQQVTGFSVAALRVKPRHLVGGLVELVRSPTATGRAIGELSPWMAQRSRDGSRDIEQAIHEMLTNPGLRERSEQFGNRYGYALQQAAQNFIDRIVWLGAYRQASAQSVTDADAVRQADAAVRMTQGSFAPEDAAKVEHAGAFTRLFLMFYSYFGGQANVLMTEARNATTAGRLALVYLYGFAIPAFVADVIAKGLRGELGGDDDDEDPLAPELLEAFFMSQARYAVAAVPVAGQVGNAVLGRFTPERFDDRVGASPVYSAVEATVRAPWSVAGAVEGETNPRQAVRDALTALQVMFGVPLGVLVRPLGYLADEDREGVTLRGLITGRDNTTSQ